MSGSDSLTGRWTGRYDYTNFSHGSPVSFDAVLTETAGALHGEIIEPNTFRHEATDTLLAVISGNRDGSRVQFIKTYTDFEEPDHPHYSGQINATATRIIGRWHFPSQPWAEGTFLLARTTEAAKRKKAHIAEEKELHD